MKLLFYSKQFHTNSEFWRIFFSFRAQLKAKEKAYEDFKDADRKRKRIERANETPDLKQRRLQTDRERKKFIREVELREDIEIESSQSLMDDDSEIPSQEALNRAWNEAVLCDLAKKSVKSNR